MSERVREWRARQGDRIRKERGRAIASACEWMARGTQAFTLTAEQIQLCEERVVSQARMNRFRASSLRPGRSDLWRRQMAAVRAALYADQDPGELPDWADELPMIPQKEASA